MVDCTPIKALPLSYWILPRDLPHQCSHFTDWHSLGGACGHIKAYGLFPIPIKKETVLKACWADLP